MNIGVAEEMDDAEDSDIIDGIDEAGGRFDELDAAEALPASIQEYEYREQSSQFRFFYLYLHDFIIYNQLWIV